MSSSQNISDVVEKVKNCPDHADEITSISNNDVENLNKDPLDEGNAKIYASFENKMEESGPKGDISIIPANDNEDLELRCDDDFDDGIEILNEEALLDEDIELDKDIIKVQEEIDNMEIQNQEIYLEKAEKITDKGLLTNDKDLQSLTSDILGQTQKLNKECDIDDNVQVILLEDEKEPENKSLVKEQNPCCIDESQKQKELNNKKIDISVTADENTSTISQHSSYQQITEHGLNKPDMMLEIPTQEFIEFSDESEDNDELEDYSLKMSPDVEIIDIEENNCIDDNTINMDEEKNESTEDNVTKSLDIDMTVLEDPKATTDALQAIVKNHESCEDVNIEVTDCQNDITTNALSYEAEIAAEIITNEMNNINVETFTKKNDLIHQENEEELNSSLVSKPDKEITSQSILKDNADIIELSDDNIEIELEDSESSSGESLTDQKVKIENAIASAELEEDILNDTEEIDNLILTTKISRTKIIENSVKLSDNLSKSRMKPCEKNTLEPTSNVNVSETKNSLQISRQNTNKTGTEPNKIEAMETSDKIPVSTTAKNLDDIASDKLTKKEDITDDVSNQAASILATHPETNSKQNSALREESRISKTQESIKNTTESIVQYDSILSSKINLVMSAKSECENEKTQEIELNNASNIFEILTEKSLASKHNNEPVLNKEESMEVDGVEQSTCVIETVSSETVNSKLTALNIEFKTSEIDVPKTSELVESQPMSKIDQNIPEMDRPQQTTSNIELQITEIDVPQLSTANIELQASEIDTPLQSKIESTTLEIIVEQPTSMIEHITSKIKEPTPSTSKVITSEISEQTSSPSKIESKSSETMKTTPSISKIEPTTSASTDTTPPNLKIEQIASEIDVSLALPPKTASTICENVYQKQSTSKIELIPSESVQPQSSSSKIESNTSETVEPQPTLKIEQITSEIDVSTQSTTKLEPITAETLRPTALPSKTAPMICEYVYQKQSTSKIELIPSEPVPPQSSSSKIESNTSETIEPQLTLKIEQIKSEIDVSTPSTTKLVPIISETLTPTALPSKIEPKISVNIDQKQSISKIELIPSEPIPPQSSSSNIESNTSETVEPQPSTSKIELQTSESNEPQPSTSKCETEASDSKPSSPKNQSDLLVQDSSNEVPEMTDSLGLLAESSRVMEDDEEHDDDDDDDGEDEDDFEPDDESSNQMTAEHSEDSNTHQSESDVPKDAEMPNDETQGFDLDISKSIIEKEPEKMVCDEDKADENTETEKAMDDETLDNNEAENETDTEVIVDETVKISDTSDTEYNENIDGGSTLKSLLLGKTPRKSSDSDYKEWTRTKKLTISKQCSNNVLSYVDLEESSSDEDKKQPQTKTTSVVTKTQGIATDDISGDDPQNEPTEIVKEAETSSSEPLQSALEKDVVKPNEPQVVAKSKSPSTDVLPETHPQETKPRSPKGLVVFSLDSDEEDSSVQQSTDDAAAVTQEPQVDQPELRGIKCINRHCANSEPPVGYYVADTSTAMYFEADTGKRAYVCEKCADLVEKRNQELIQGMKNFTPLFQLHTARNSEELVEISDSDSDEEPEPTPEQLQIVGEDGAKMLEEQLADMINETWAKFNMDDRILDAQNDLQKEIERLQKESQVIDAMFNECQAATDRLRNSLYATFDPEIQELPSIVIYDMPNCSYSCLEPPTNERRQYKRRLSPSKETLETPAKKLATPSPTPTPVLPDTAPEDSSNEEQEPKTPVVEKFDDDNMDISVVTLAAEAAPADLPPPGDLSHPPLKVGMTVFAMKNAFGTWLRAKVVEIQPKMHNMPFTMVRVRFEHKVSKNPFKTLPARCLAYFEPSEVRMTIGTRVIALFKSMSARQAYYSGIVAEIPNPVNNYRYLIFFDDGYAQYAPHSQTRLVCEFSSLVWEEVHPYSREFVRSYLLAYPERPMVRLHAGQNLKTEWRGKWWSSRVVSVDSSLVEVQFLRCDRREWIYRGSTRLAPLYLELQAAERHRPRALPRTQPQARINMPYVEYTRSDEQANKLPQTNQQRQVQLQQQNEEIRRQRAVAKKSTAFSMPPPPQSIAANLDQVTSRVVFYTPKNSVKPLKITPHTCSPKCKRTDVLALKDLRTYNPLAKPLLSGWERQTVRYKGYKEVMYVAPCGRRLRNVRELHRYLRITDSEMAVDLFDFSASTHCLAEFVLNRCFVGKKDLSHGKEIVPVPCVNYYDESLPEFCSYNTERTPTAGVPLNLDPEFLCGCDCEDDCEDKTKCACWQMTLEGARTIGYEGDVGYVYRRLPEPLPSGIYECNSRCKCKNTCLNRVAQHPLQLKLQVFKTHNRGWGIRALNDVPKGAFLCIYAGNLLTDATANLDGLNEGDEYLAELDYIEVVEQMKEGFEEDIPDKIKAKDKKELAKKQAAEDDDDDEEDEESSEEETTVNKNEREDGDFEPGYIGLGVAEFSKRLRRRDSKKEAEDAKQQEKEKETNADEECITISDDEEVREPSCFTAAAGMGKNQFISKYRSVRTLFGEDEACYIMDAKVQGNIGRYLNHSCTPNVFVQNVFVDTHDPRFPWVAFFALHHIRAGTELTWNYNYDVGSVPGKVLYCFCGAPNCRGRLL